MMLSPPLHEVARRRTAGLASFQSMSLLGLVALVALGGLQSLGGALEENLIGEVQGEEPVLGSQSHADTSLIHYSNNAAGRERAEAYVEAFCTGNGITCTISEAGGNLMISTTSDDRGALINMGAPSDIYNVSGPAGKVVGSNRGSGSDGGSNANGGGVGNANGGDNHNHGSDAAGDSGGGNTASSDQAGASQQAAAGDPDPGRPREQLVTDFQNFATALLTNAEGEEIARMAFGLMRPGNDFAGMNGFMREEIQNQDYSGYGYEELAELRGELYLAMEAVEGHLEALDGNKDLTGAEREILREELEETLTRLESRDEAMRDAQTPNFDNELGFNETILSLIASEGILRQDGYLTAYVNEVQKLSETHESREADRERFTNLQSKRAELVEQIKGLKESGADMSEYLALQEQLADIDTRLERIETRDAERAEEQHENGASIVMPELQLEGELKPVGPDVNDTAAVEAFLQHPGREVLAYSDGVPTTIRVMEVEGYDVEVKTAQAYGEMQQAAAADGVRLRLVSGHRSMEKQEYLYNCYRTGQCNNGNLAARPGHSNHQSGEAIDIQTHASYTSAEYKWLAANAHKFDFYETVASEPWHWEYLPERSHNH